MPYKIERRGDKHCVVKSDTGKTVKCHDSMKKAEAHMAALRINVEAEEKSFQWYSQDEAEYALLSAIPGQACANCRFFSPGGEYPNDEQRDMCRIVGGGPDPILTTGWCNKWAARRRPEQEVIPVQIVEMDEETEDDDEMKSMAVTASRKVPFIKSLIAQIFRQKSFVMEADGFKVDGNRWHAWYTNNWYDLEDEVFPVKGIDFFINRVKSGEVPYPQLWFSHIETMPHGKADFIGRVGNKVLAAGSFDDSFLAHRMKAYYRAAQKRGVRFRVSHGFTYEPRLKINGAYYLFKTFEISPIPEVGTLRAANPYTSWEVKTMQIPNDLRREIAAALSNDGKTVNDATLGLADNLIAGANKDMQQAQGEGRQSKSTLTPADVDSKLDTAMAGVNEKLDKLAGALEKALGAFETGVQTNVKTADQFKAIDERLKAVEAWQKQQTELAPPASRSPLTQLNPDSALAKLLADYEAKTSEKPLSLVEMATGQRSTEIDPALLNGGQQS